ncbi:hypothetical protein Pse7367_1009 [Thalassoporum mexicanum PCC 7367]|nr:hypothetical protein Pse7367_1009 [Pseudanabaena sp. PCC 7367]
MSEIEQGFNRIKINHRPVQLLETCLVRIAIALDAITSSYSDLAP